MNRIILTLALLILSCSSVQAKCIVNTACEFDYVPVKISDGYSRDSTLTLLSPDDLDIAYKIEGATSWTVISTQADSCPPSATGACMTQFATNTGWYRIVLGASLVTTSNKRLCININDKQGTRTVPDTAICQDVEEGGTVWATYEIVDLTNEGGDQNPTTTSSDTNLTWTVNFTNTTPQPIMYFPTTAEDARQSASCTVQGLRTEVTGYNTSTKVISYRALPAAPHYLCTFRIY